MHRWKIILGSLLALLIMAAAPLSIMAANDNETGGVTAGLNLKGALAIVAPRVVYPGSELSLAVFLRQDQTPQEGVQVWAAGKDRITAIQKDIQALRKKVNDGAAWNKLQSLLESGASRIGVTDEAGKVTSTFSESGKYWLIAVKAGYAPDCSALLVRNVLVITGEKTASIGENVTFTVNEKGTQDAVSNAEIWSVSRENSSELKAAIKTESLAHKGDLENVDWAEVLDAHASSLGTTDENGQLTTAFDKEGTFLLITALKGDLSGFNRIIIKTP
jgi:hypothetical protein